MEKSGGPPPLFPTGETLGLVVSLDLDLNLCILELMLGITWLDCHSRVPAVASIPEFAASRVVETRIDDDNDVGWKNLHESEEERQRDGAYDMRGGGK